MAEASRNPGMKSYLIVWNGLLYIAAAEVFLTYYGFSTHMLLAILLSLAFIEAGVALLYFMHLKYERPGLRWGLLVAVLFVLLMMNQIWPDAYRMASIALH